MLRIKKKKEIEDLEGGKRTKLKDFQNHLDYLVSMLRV